LKADPIHSVNTKPASALNLSWRDQRYHRFYEVVDYLVQELQEHVWLKTGKPRRRLKGDGLEKLHYAVECLVRDCMAVVLQRKRKGEAAIRKGQHYYSSNRPDQMLTYSVYIERAYEGLLELGYIEVTKPGYFDRKGRKDGTPTSRLTRYVASDRLLSLFTVDEIRAIPAMLPSYQDPELIRVRVKEKDENGVSRKRSLAVVKTPQALQMHENLRIINKALSKHWYDLEIPDEELSYRVFNDPELFTGGRFYGGWWQNIPREYRRYMIVNGKQMVELDYSNQHPSILYAQASVSRPDDCYSDVIKLHNLPQGLTSNDLRDMVKAAFNAMLNSPKQFKQAPSGVNPAKFGLKWADVSESIMDYHKPIAHHFYTGVGLRLQRMDSDIAEKVLLHFAHKGIAILPLHDSFMMHHGYESSLEPVMSSAFEEVVGLSPKIDRKQASRRSDFEHDDRYDDFGSDTSLDIKELLESRCGHDLRLDAFYSLKVNN
jgi:hypothetical protein